MTTETTKANSKAVSQAKPKAAAKKPTKQEQAAAAVERMRQAALQIVQPSPVAEIVQIPVNFIRCAPQVRTEFCDETIRELAEDIADRGLIQPILVRPGSDGYVIVAGERRYRAAKLAGVEMIAAIVSDMDNDMAAAVQIAENIQREDLSVSDTAKAVRKLYEIHGNSITTTAAKLHKSKAWVSKHVAASCPDLRQFAKTLLEEGFTEDLEIVLAIDKLQLIDWCGARDLAEKVKKGEAGRRTVLDALAKAKKIEAERQAEREKAKDPEAVKAEAKTRAEQAAKWEEEQRQEKAARQRQPNYICNHVCREAEYEPDDRDGISEEQRQIMAAHLDLLHTAGKTASHTDALREVVRMTNHGDYTPLEIAAYVQGMLGQRHDGDELVNLTVNVISNESA